MLTVTVCGEVDWPTVTENVRLAGLAPSAGGAIPIPLNDTVSACVRVESMMLSVPV